VLKTTTKEGNLNLGKGLSEEERKKSPLGTKRGKGDTDTYDHPRVVGEKGDKILSQFLK